MSLTRHPEGSLRELGSLALPLMLSSLSVTMMIFIDRLLLAHYSTEALNAVANSMTLGWAYLCGWIVLTGISEVFVAQYNGAKIYQKLGEPVWQMIWLSLASVLFFIPLALGVDSWFFLGADQELERDYLKWMFWFGPTWPLYSALCGFFIGQGKTHLVTLVAIFANFINAALDYLLIFGREGWLEPMGVEGAAIATSGSSVFQIAVLGAVFLKRSNRRQFGTGNFRLRLNSLWQCVRIGLPGAAFVTIELLGWAAFYQMMAYLSVHHITVASVSQSLVILFTFFADAVSKATSAISGNLIGAKRPSLISSVIYSGVRLHLLFFGAVVLLFYCFSESVLLYFLPHVAPEQFPVLEESLHFCLFAMCVYLFFEGLRLVFAGVLTAAGDTVFLLLAGTLSVWLLLIAPVYFWVVQGERSVEWAYFFTIFYSVSASLFYFWRVKSGSWKNLSLISENSLNG